jgi:hypothetical protein
VQPLCSPVADHRSTGCDVLRASCAYYIEGACPRAGPAVGYPVTIAGPVDQTGPYPGSIGSRDGPGDDEQTSI